MRVFRVAKLDTALLGDEVFGWRSAFSAAISVAWEGWL